MPTTLKTFSVLALLAMASPLAAQEAPAEAPAAEAPAAEAPAQDPAATATPEAPAEGAAPAPGGDLSLGQPADGATGEAEVGQPYIREEFGAWGLRCLRTEDGNDPCQLYQLLLDAEGNAVAEISLFPLPEGREAVAGATIVAPLETLLTENLTLSVDGANTRQYPFTFCNRAGCVARVGFTAAEVDQFRAGNAAQLAIVPAAAPDQQVTLDISLSGFTAGYEAAGQSAPTIPPQ
jgi:invasion protein IalB